MSVVRRSGSRMWYIQFQWNGQLYLRSARTLNKRLAEQLEAEWRAQLYRQQYLGERERITLAKALELFCRSKERTPHHGALAANSKAILKSVPASRRLDEVTRQDVERFLRDREAAGLSAQTIKHGVGLLRCSIAYVKQLGYRVPDIAFPAVKVPRYKERYLTEDEEARLLLALDPNREAKGLAPHAMRSPAIKQSMQDAYDLTVLLLDTGCRYSEIANIEWARIDIAARAIHVWRSKTSTETLIFMTDRVFEVLSRRKTVLSGRWVFENKKGDARGYAGRAIAKAIKRAGIAGATIHTLRHTLASKLIRNGLSLYEVSTILGHSSPATTQRYAHLDRRSVSVKARDVINALNGPLRPLSPEQPSTVPGGEA